MASTLKTPNFNAYRRTIPAQDQTQIDAEGDFFYVKESEQPLLFQMDLGPDLPWDVGTGPDSRGNAQFSRLTIKNPWSVPVVVVIYIGKGGVVDNRFTLVPSRDFALRTMKATTRFKAISGTIPANSVIDFPGVFALPDRYRDTLIISNIAANLDLEIADPDGQGGCVVFAKTTSLVQCSGPLKLINRNPSPIDFRGSEIIYTG